jgi:hypothetical protein
MNRESFSLSITCVANTRVKLHYLDKCILSTLVLTTIIPQSDQLASHISFSHAYAPISGPMIKYLIAWPMIKYSIVKDRSIRDNLIVETSPFLVYY